MAQITQNTAGGVANAVTGNAQNQAAVELQKGENTQNMINGVTGAVQGLAAGFGSGNLKFGSAGSGMSGAGSPDANLNNSTSQALNSYFPKTYSNRGY
jgi:hypothetical protein